MIIERRLAEIRRLAGVPQAQHGRAVGAAARDLSVGGEQAQHGLIQRFLRRLEARARRRRGKRAEQARQGLEVERAIAP